MLIAGVEGIVDPRKGLTAWPHGFCAPTITSENSLATGFHRRHHNILNQNKEGSNNMVATLSGVSHAHHQAFCPPCGFSVREVL